MKLQAISHESIQTEEGMDTMVLLLWKLKKLISTEISEQFSLVAKTGDWKGIGRWVTTP